MKLRPVTWCITAIFVATGIPVLAASSPALNGAAIPFAQIGTKATADYQGDALGISATAEGARLRCGFQKLEGCATAEGLWLESTADSGGRFQVVSVAVGRAGDASSETEFPLAPLFNLVAVPQGGMSPLHFQGNEVRADLRRLLQRDEMLAPTGEVAVAEKLVRYIRPGLTEEYSVSVDGVRQDFVITERPMGDGDLRVELALTGAQAEAMAYGAKLKLDGSSRTLAYSRLRATDATGKELTARMKVTGRAGSPLPAGLDTEIDGAHGVARPTLAICVDDADAVYPVRIDPTFSDANWVSISGFSGANEGVAAAVLDVSGNLYIGGAFTMAGDVTAKYIARWDGSNWSALGAGLNGPVDALAVSGSDLYAGGGFTTAGGSGANRVAKWDGSSWSALGSGLNSAVAALAVSGTNLYVGGIFTNAGGITANRIAKWNGSSWSALGSGVNSSVYALAVLESDLYVGGSFTTAGGIMANRIAKWNGSGWSALGSGVSGQPAYPDFFDSAVSALAVLGSDLYVGGNFTRAGGNAANCVAKWDGSSWSALGSGVNNMVHALAVSGTDLFAGGYFTNAGGIQAKHVANWDGSSWSALGSGVNNMVYALVVSCDAVYAGGVFTDAGGTSAKHVAKWNGSSWSALGLGINNIVDALAVSGGTVYAGGLFTTGGGTTVNYIAKWNGSSWSALGSGVDARVSALAAAGSDLYAAVLSRTAGGGLAHRIAKWNGSSWSALGSMDAWVRALAVSGSDLYVGGSFTTAGGTEAICVAKWDGSSWSALGSGMNGYVLALAVSGSDLYAGGDFTTAGGITANRIAKWNGSSWSALGSGANGAVRALAVSSSDLYAGGDFTTAGGITANRIAKWNGSSWSALGPGVGGGDGYTYVRALAVSGSDLYVGGGFTTAGGSAASCVAKWNGNSWSALGSGMTIRLPNVPYVSALAVSGSDLYAGGIFTAAGGKASPYIARAYLERPYLSILRSGGTVTLSWPTFYENFVLQQNPGAANPGGWSPANYPLTTNGDMTSATVPLNPTNRFFRLMGN